MAATAGRAGAALPDVNVETYPFDFVQHLLDETADANLLAVPRPGPADWLSLTADRDDWFGLNGGYGLALASDLRRFESTVVPGCGESPPKARQVTGETVGVLRALCLFGPPDLPWTPGGNPPPALMDPWRPQSFAVMDAHFDFGGNDEFSGYGRGRTYPIHTGGQPRVLFGAVGNVMTGYGKFRGLEGTFVMTGTLAELGFLGNVTFRFVDPDAAIRSDRKLPPPTEVRDPDPASTYFVMRGIKRDSSVKTTYGPPPGDERVNLVTPSVMRSAQFLFDNAGQGPQSGRIDGPVVADMRAEVLFNLLAPPGSAEHAAPFTTQETYTFEGPAGAVIRAGVTEGIAFALRFRDAPKQQGVRFAGFGPITGGTGPFAAAQGMLTVNSVIGIAPHSLSLIHVVHLADPANLFRGGCG